MTRLPEPTLPEQELSEQKEETLSGRDLMSEGIRFHHLAEEEAAIIHFKLLPSNAEGN